MILFHMDGQLRKLHEKLTAVWAHVVRSSVDLANTVKLSRTTCNVHLECKASICVTKVFRLASMIFQVPKVSAFGCPHIRVFLMAEWALAEVVDWIRWVKIYLDRYITPSCDSTRAFAGCVTPEVGDEIFEEQVVTAMLLNFQV